MLCHFRSESSTIKLPPYMLIDAGMLEPPNIIYTLTGTVDFTKNFNCFPASTFTNNHILCLYYSCSNLLTNVFIIFFLNCFYSTSNCKIICNNIPITIIRNSCIIDSTIWESYFYFSTSYSFTSYISIPI